MKHLNKSQTMLWLMVLLANLSAFAQTTGSLKVLYCNKAVYSPVSFTKNVPYNGTATIHYMATGGTYEAGSVASTGMTGFTASWSAGSFVAGVGTITVTITGTATSDGNAAFPITIGGKSGMLSIGSCGAYITGYWKEFLCHNLGADMTLDPHVPVLGLNGAYIQAHKRGPNTTGDSRIDWQTAPTDGANGFVAQPTASNAEAGDIANWNISATTMNWLTVSGEKSSTDPCPDGYRVPRRDEWNALKSSNTNTGNTISSTGTWTESSTNYGCAIHYGPNATTKTLTLPAAGYRTYNVTYGYKGRLTSRGLDGYYWASTGYGTSDNNHLRFNVSTSGTITSTVNNLTTQCATPIRCIAD